MNSPIANLTLEHLGDAATEDDLFRFKNTCLCVLPAFDSEDDPEQAAIDYVWNDGRIRWDADSCIYCNGPIPAPPMYPPPLPPDVTDVVSWAELAEVHRPGCEWIVTRAHRLPEVE